MGQHVANKNFSERTIVDNIVNEMKRSRWRRVGRILATCCSYNGHRLDNGNEADHWTSGGTVEDMELAETPVWLEELFGRFIGLR